MNVGSGLTDGRSRYPVPDSEVCRDAEGLLRRTSQPALVNHCLRSYLWGAALADAEGVKFDPELLFVSAALHDLGLLPQFDTGAAFEADSAAEARRFAADHGLVGGKALKVAEAIVLHMAPDVTLDHGHEAYLLWHATSIDVTGAGIERLSATTISQGMTAYPRLDFVKLFGQAFADQAGRKPSSSAAHAVRHGLLERLAACPLNEPQAPARPGDRAGSS